MSDASRELSLRPIGVVRSPFLEKAAAPRQPRAALASYMRTLLASDEFFFVD